MDNHTGRGLGWILVGLSTALVTFSLSLIVSVAFLTFPNFTLDLFGRSVLGWSHLLVQVFGYTAALLGVPSLWRGREELGPSHGIRVRQGLVAISVGIAAALAFTALSLLLGFFYVEEGWRAVIVQGRSLLGVAVAISAGLFLFWAIEGTASRVTFPLSLSALVVGVLGAARFTPTGGYVPELLTVVSVGLWIAAYQAALAHVRHPPAKVGKGSPAA